MLHFTRRLIAASLCLVGLATAPQAATLATAMIDGTYEIATGSTTDASTFEVEGSFMGSLNPLAIPAGDAIYTLNANIMLNGSTILDDSVSAFGTQDDLLFGAIVGLTIADILAANSGVTQTLPGGVGTLTYDIFNLAAPGPFSGGGDYTIAVETIFPIGPLVDTAISDFLGFAGIDPVVLGGFKFPNNDDGDFKFTFSVDVEPVPLPAGFVLLLTGLAGLGFARWRATA